MTPTTDTQPSPWAILEPETIAALPDRLTVWSPHGGTGCSTIALALGAAIAPHRPAVVRGASPRAAAMLAEPLGINVGDELDGPRDVMPGLTIAGPLVDAHALEPSAVDVVDVGARLRWPDQDAGYVLAVIPATYHALRRAIAHPCHTRTHRAIVATSDADALTPGDVTVATGWALAATVPQARRIRSACDAGVLAVRPPEALGATVAYVLEAIAESVR